MACFTVTIFAEDEDEDENNDDEDEHEAGLRMWPGPSISTKRQNHRKPRANHVTLRFFQQSCARDSEMLILGNSSLIILW